MKYILMDMEGTTTSLSFIQDVLVPYSKERIEAFVNSQIDNVTTAEVLTQTKKTVREETQQIIDDNAAIAQLINWVETNRQHPALRALQENIWKVGFKSGELKGHVYPDVPLALESWKASGILMAVYSSISVEMQKVLLGHSVSGDLTTFIENHFDATIGQKRDVKSYHAISSVLRLDPVEMLFLSDNVEELDAAKMAGMQTIQLVRQADAPFKNHKQVRNFLEIKF